MAKQNRTRPGKASMTVARRRLLAALAAIPVLMVARRGADLAGEALAGAARSARPATAGTSATRCAQCGSPDHTMLDPICALAPRVLS